MRWIGIFGSMVAVVAALLVMGASSASATVLCEVNENPCGGEGYGEGTVVEASLSTGTKAVLKSIWATIECSESKLNSKVEKPGGESGEAVSGPITTLSFSGCNCPETTLQNGTMEISYTGSGNGTLVGKSSKVTFNCTGLGTSCIYGTAATGTTLGKVSGGSPATINVEASLPWVSGDSGSFLCGTTATLSASYTVSAPKPLFVEEALIIPSLTLTPAKLVFVAAEKGNFQEIKVENTGLRAAKLSEDLIDPNEVNFKIIRGMGAGTCVIGNFLGITESCTVRVKFETGNLKEKGIYTLKYGTQLFPKLRTGRVDIES